MNSVLARTIDTHCPKINPMVTEGASTIILKGAADYLDRIFKSFMESLQPGVDLVYEGYRRPTPDEEFRNYVAKDGSNPTYDIAESSIYMVIYQFRYQGIIIEKPLYLPYTENGNLLRISGTPWSIVPVLSDTVISPNNNGIFVRLLKDKLTFSSKAMNFIKNGQQVSEFVISTVIIKNASKEHIPNVVPVSLYLAGQYGFKEVFRRYFGTDKVLVALGDTSHLEAEYDIYESKGIKPMQLKVNCYTPHGIKICVHKSVDPHSYLLKNFVYGLLYALDFSRNDSNEIVSVIMNNKLDVELMFWRLLLGQITFKGWGSVEHITNMVDAHFQSLEGYLDPLTKDNLATINIYSENFFDLMAVILTRYQELSRNNLEYNSNISNRYIDILYYLLYEIIISFNKVIMAINNRANKPGNKEISVKEIQKIFTEKLSQKIIFKLIKSTKQNLAILMSDTTVDTKYLKITSVLQDQSCGRGVVKESKSAFPASTQKLRGHDLYFGSILFLTKTAPTPRFRSNIYMHYNIHSGKLEIPDYLKVITDRLDELLVRNSKRRDDAQDPDEYDLDLDKGMEDTSVEDGEVEETEEVEENGE